MNNLENIHKFLKGVNFFYENFSRKNNDAIVVWQEGSTRILEYTTKFKPNSLCLFFIPSLINKSYILDLDEETSIVRYYANLGYKVYLVDFIEPKNEELMMNFVDFKERIAKGLAEVCKQNKVITVGYCLGGLFSCALTKASNLNIVGQVLIATPWDFSHFKKLFGLDNPLTLTNFKLMLETFDRVPAFLIQLFFSFLSPGKIWNKFCQFSSSKDPKEIDRFLKIEQWINDGISLTKPFALECLELINQDLSSSSDVLGISLADIKTPTLIVNASEDNIVPIISSSPLYNLTNKEIIVGKTGHIGLVVSKTACENILPKIDQWLQQVNQ
ncbi:MAG: alpha/beta fold hydrolase [Rickettsiales bacterium]